MSVQWSDSCVAAKNLYSITSSARWCRVNEKHEPVSDIDTEWSIARKHLTQTAD
jgi:hypothetical protein